MLLLTDDIYALQSQLILTGDYASQDRYEIQLAKTVIDPMNIASEDYRLNAFNLQV